MAHWCGASACEDKAQEHKVTIRCIPLDGGDAGRCVACGEPSPQRVVFAKAY